MVAQARWRPAAQKQAAARDTAAEADGAQGHDAAATPRELNPERDAADYVDSGPAVGEPRAVCGRRVADAADGRAAASVGVGGGAQECALERVYGAREVPGESRSKVLHSA